MAKYESSGPEMVETVKTLTLQDDKGINFEVPVGKKILLTEISGNDEFYCGIYEGKEVYCDCDEVDEATVLC